jgi:hypothetical protein
LKPIPLEWLEKVAAKLGDTPDVPNAGVCPPMCCGKLMLYDEGEPMTRDHPGEPPCFHCAECGLTQDAGRDIQRPDLDRFAYEHHWQRPDGSIYCVDSSD